jgi:hypothetical protein
MKHFVRLLSLLLVATAVHADYIGDFAPGTTAICGQYTTYNPSTGAPYTLAGTPALAVYKIGDGTNSTTESTTGVTHAEDVDSRTGMNRVCIDTSADGTFYAAGGQYSIVITTGTVNSVSVVGSEVKSFSLNKVAALRPATAGRTLVVDSAGLADANTVKLGPSGSGTAQTARDIGASVLLSNGTGTGQLSLSSGAVLLQATQTGVTIPNVTTVTNLTNAPTSGDFTSTMKTSIGTAVAASAVASVTGNVGGNVAGSVGSVATGGITEASFATTAGSFAPLNIADQGTAQAATTTTLQLRSAATFADNELVGSWVEITGGSAGVGQTAQITGYTGSTDTATVPTWATTPTGTITYKIYKAPKNLTANTTQIGGTSQTARDIGASVLLSSGTGSGQISLSSGAVLLQPTQTGVTIPTVTTLTNAPSDSSGTTSLLSRLTSTRAGYLDNLSAGAVPTATQNAAATWDLTTTGHTTGGTFGAAMNAAGSAGDPWATSLPGSYASGSAGYILGNMTGGSGLDAAGVRSAIGLATANLDTQLAALQSDTDNLQTRVPTSLVSGRMDASVGAYQTGLAPLQPTTAGRTLDVSTTGEAGIDWANIGSPTTTVALTGTTVGTATTLTNAPSDSSGTTTLLSRLSATRAGYLDNLSAGAVATGASIAALNNLSSAQAQTAAAAALTAYDPPTRAEATSDTNSVLAAIPTAAAVSAQVLADQRILTGTCDSGSATTCVDDALTQAAASQLQDRLICFSDSWCALITTFAPSTDTVTTTKTAPSTRASKAYTIFPSTSQ